jgi:hypothetical protein
MCALFMIKIEGFVLTASYELALMFPEVLSFMICESPLLLGITLEFSFDNI